MGKSLYDGYAAARAVFEEADRALGFSISKLCFEGPEDALKLTENTQPALLTVSTAACRVLEEQGLQPDYVAGHSLGEYSALVAAGALAFADAVRLVRNRGRYMQEAVPPGVGAMAALLKLPAEKLEPCWPGRAGRSGLGGQPELAGPGGDRGPCGRGGARHGTGQSGRGEARRAAAGERAVPLRAHEARAGTAGARTSTPPRSPTCAARW